MSLTTMFQYRHISSDMGKRNWKLEWTSNKQRAHFWLKMKGHQLTLKMKASPFKSETKKAPQISRLKVYTPKKYKNVLPPPWLESQMSSMYVHKANLERHWNRDTLLITFSGTMMSMGRNICGTTSCLKFVGNPVCDKNNNSFCTDH